MTWLKLTGKLIYDPNRNTEWGGEFRKQHKLRTLILQLPRDELDLYYQWFLQKKFGQWLDLQRPMYGKHITVVKGDERIRNLDKWKAHQGRKVEIEYSPRLQPHWKFWCLPVRSPKLQELRNELGLSTDFKFHITVGRQYDWQPLIQSYA
jgi:hypothetical protein